MVDTHDFVIIGAGPAGEAAAFKARERDASVAVVDSEWFGGSCPYIGCVPSKSLLAGAARHHANPATDAWPAVSTYRDFMINRPADADVPDDSGHVKSLTDAGAVVYRGTGAIARRGVVRIRHDSVSHELAARNVVVAVGSVSKTPPIEGLDAVRPWTNREATLTRELPRSLIVLGGGPTGCELAQVYARFGVPTTIVQSGPRLAPTDHPRNSDVLRATLEADGVLVRTGVRATRAKAGAGKAGAHVIELDDDSTVEGHVVLLAVGRDFPIDDLGLEHYGIDTSGRTALPRDGRLRVADGLWIVGDPAGPELHTHQAHYQGEMAVRMALGEDVTPDYRALPRATYTDPEAASVGVSLEGARAAGLDAFELVAEFAKSTRGYAIQAKLGHVTIVVDRGTRELVGAALACPDASAAIHECVLAIKAHITVDVLAETIHAFPSTSRSFNGLFADARTELDRVRP
ncbi:MAG TPA: NAD(P)/FAD-dependent oxidoreductase [Candidatus Limnocylindrales bacterium]|nr:NAD(P)/FAD-dependent oxidoreductase [Candidatus Limnocylindrales bacterium]